jgi:tetratricopeptide (TPR) repeat protein
MYRCILHLAVIVALLAGTTLPASQKPSPENEARKLAALVIAEKIPEAVESARGNPGLVGTAVAVLTSDVDDMITQRKIADAQKMIKVALKFIIAFQETGENMDLPTAALRGRELRLEGIQQSDNKEYADAEITLREALKLSEQAEDTVLEAGIRNNLGYSLRYQGRLEEAAREFDTARKIAEEQKDDLRAGSYNFNLGLALIGLKRHSPALDAFRRSAEQNHAAGMASLEARATLYQGVALGAINAVSTEPIRHFEKAQKMFEQLGDAANTGWAFYLMGDHIAYSMKFDQAAQYGEQAIPFFKKAGDTEGLRRCYMLLSDMYTRLKQDEKANTYRKLAGEIPSKKPPGPRIL